MKKINISTKKYPNTFTLVDDSTFDWLNQWKWRRNTFGHVVRGNGARIFLHRIINKTPKGFQTDHINRNPLDNQKSNLRTVTSTINQLNTSLRKDNKSTYKGVGWNKRAKKWRVRISINKEQIHLGYFLNLEEAFSARQKAEQEWIK